MNLVFEISAFFLIGIWRRLSCPLSYGAFASPDSEEERDDILKNQAKKKKPETELRVDWFSATLTFQSKYQWQKNRCSIPLPFSFFLLTDTNRDEENLKNIFKAIAGTPFFPSHSHGTRFGAFIWYNLISWIQKRLNMDQDKSFLLILPTHKHSWTEPTEYVGYLPSVF